jgi:hypothetical protein
MAAQAHSDGQRRPTRSPAKQALLLGAASLALLGGTMGVFMFLMSKAGIVAVLVVLVLASLAQIGISMRQS